MYEALRHPANLSSEANCSRAGPGAFVRFASGTVPIQFCRYAIKMRGSDQREPERTGIPCRSTTNGSTRGGTSLDFHATLTANA